MAHNSKTNDKQIGRIEVEKAMELVLSVYPKAAPADNRYCKFYVPHTYQEGKNIFIVNFNDEWKPCEALSGLCIDSNEAWVRAANIINKTILKQLGS